MKLILLGAPGAWQGLRWPSGLIRALSIPSISTGNILREQVAAGTELGPQRQGVYGRGQAGAR